MEDQLTEAVRSTREHPAWCVYDELRTARLNIKYNQCIIQKLRRSNLALEILIAVATSSAVAGFSFWDTALGGWLWKVIGGIATILSIVKPLLKLPDQIKRKSELLVGYHVLEFDLSKISIEIRHRHKYDDTLQKQFMKALERKAELVKRDADSGINEKLRLQCYRAVEKELPESSFYIPPPEIENARPAHSPRKDASTPPSSSSGPSAGAA